MRLTVLRWYGAGPHAVEVATGVAVWHHSGEPVMPLRWVLIRDPQQQFRPQALPCTDPERTPALLGLFSLVTVCAHRLAQQGSLPLRLATLHRKSAPTFADALAAVRRSVWRTPRS